ncbi:MAG: excisionase [Oscillospiraceae bacterium]|nr:excisionase [Oscillospiraceae bacterium]
MKYLLMHKTNPVLRMELDEGTGTIASVGEVFARARVPVGVGTENGAANRVALNGWWAGRAIPASRSGLRDALEVMQVPSPQVLLAKCYGLSLSDQYWARPENSNLRWEDINFFDNAFSEDVGNILFGQIPENDTFSLLSPDNTSDGWLRKKWKIIGGKRCLIKGGSGATRQEPYNEVLASEIMRRLGIAHIPYTLTVIDEYPYSVCEDFITAETELVSAWHIAQTQKKENNISPYSHFQSCCRALGIPDIKESIEKMLTVDYLIVNEDRHYNNFGVIRNADTLEWMGFAPVFDCGTSLWYDKPNAMIRPLAKAPSKPFGSSHDEQIKLIDNLDWLDFSLLKGVEEAFFDILSGSPFIDAARRDALCRGLAKRVAMLRDDKKRRAYETDACEHGG